MEKIMATLIFCLLTFCAGFSSADSPDVLFKQGNAAFEQGKFSEAITTYESLKANGSRSWMLEYNLGNAYYRSGQLGKAVAHYARAFRLNSGEGDVIENLNLASTKAGDPLLPSSGLATFFWRLFYFFSLNTLTLFASLFFLSLCGLGFSRLSGVGKFSGELWVLLGCAFFTFSGWLGARWSVQSQAMGIVVTSVAEVRSGPNTSYPANFTIPEGRRVLVLEEQEPVQGWLEIGVPQEGLKGWVPGASIETI
jgi:hypothetical protein